MSIWLVGAGLMAQGYAKVLSEIGKPFDVIGRGENSAKIFEQMTKHTVRTGGLKNALNSSTAPRQAIIAVGVEQLASTATELILAGTKRILIEKPGGIDFEEINSLNIVAEKYNATVLLAYNRRFYRSVAMAKEYIINDGGVLSAQFEFTEWSHEIEKLSKGKGVLERWLLGNSSHVIDLVFHLIGKPSDWSFWHSGSLLWHPDSARFSGAGVSEKNILFSYLSDWQSPGRWGIELNTAKHKLIFRPMEKLHITQIGSVAVEEVDLECELDMKFKPGLYNQTASFLNSNDQLFCSIKEQVENVKIYSEIAGYSTNFENIEGN
jgi:hypothetical protein